MVETNTARYADMFAALGSEPRLEIMRSLFAAYPSGMTVGEIQENLKIPNSTLSHHLEKLRNESLVNCQKEKQFLRYSANAETMEDLLSFLTTGKSRGEALRPTNNTSTQSGFMVERFFASIFEKLFGLTTEIQFPGFERFTHKAIISINIARSESRRLGHRYVGTEQILLGLIGEGSGFASQFLSSVGVNIENAQTEVEKIIGRGNGNTPVDIPFTPRAKRVLKFSLQESRQLGIKYIGTEHLLLGLLKEGEGVGVKVLQNLGVDRVALEQRVRSALT